MDPALDGELESLRARLSATRFPLSTPESAEFLALAAAAADQLGDYILPRLRSFDAPLLTVVAGSTGAGKSALVNSLVGHVVSRSGVLRPTTRAPVLVHHPDDGTWFDDDRILPQLPRVSGTLTDADRIAGDGPAALHVVADRGLPAGLALLDAPDIDSVAGANRELAATLMAAADLWLFVTTAARYADAVPWSVLRAASERDASVALVLNRVPPEALVEVSEHLRALLAGEGLSDAPLFVIAEESLRDGLLDPSSIGDLRRWLQGLAGDASARAAVARRTVDGALGALAVDVVRVADAADRQVRSGARLVEMAEASFAAGSARVAEIGADGSLLRGEVLARWQEFVGAGTLTQSLETRMARVRDAIGRVFRGEPAQAEPIVHALESGIARVLVDELSGAYERTDSMWRDDPVGRTLAQGRDLAVPPPTSSADAETLVREWQGDVLDMVRGEGADRRGSARALAYGVNGAALALMVVVFSATGGLTGAEVGIAGGSAVLAQKVLEALFSEDAVRRMSATARTRLTERVEVLFADHERSFTGLLADLELDPANGTALRLHVAALLAARDQLATSDLSAMAAQPSAAAPGRGSVASAGTRPRATVRRRLRGWWRGAG